MTMGEIATPRSPLQSDSEGSTSSLELGSGVAGLVLNGTPPASLSPASAASAAQEAVKCRWQHCGLWLANLDALALHVTLAHAAAGRGGLFYCGWEGCSRGHRGFNARYKMLVHVRTHTNERPHRCSQCDKSFSRAENLKIHARSHTGERPYTCPVPGCTKAYSNSSDRFKHTRTHAVDKPYVCKVEGCPKRYTDPSSLRKHVKTYRHFPSGSHSPVGSPAASDLDSPSDNGSPLPGSPHGSPHGSPSSDEDASTRSAFRPVAANGLVSPSALDRPPLPGECRGIPIKKAISARMSAVGVRHHDLLATSSSSSSARAWAGGSVWVGNSRNSGTTSPDALSLSMSPSSSPSPSPSSSSGSAVASSPADWLTHGSVPMYSSPMNSPSPPWPWGPMMSLWPMAAAAAFAPAHHSQMHAQAPLAVPVGLMDHREHPATAAQAAQAAPLDLTMTRH